MELDDVENESLLEKRQALTESLYELPYDLVIYLQRAAVYSNLGYPDLAAGDAYRALLLSDEVCNESFEYHEQASEALRPYSTGAFPDVLQNSSVSAVLPHIQEVADECMDLSIGEADLAVRRLAKLASIRCFQTLSISLLLCGCLKSAYEFCSRGLALLPGDVELLQAQDYVRKLIQRRLKGETADFHDFPDQGLVRREVYPWNDHEPDRFSDETLDFLNAQLSTIAPKCAVKVTELPTLIENADSADSFGILPTNKQLGLFAQDDIAPLETVLEEISVLTANNRLKESLCDACSSRLPELGAERQAVPCDDCQDTMFCDETCYQRAMNSYHPAVCDKDVDTIAKDPDPKEAPNALYLLLLARALAMSATQETHPLDLKEVKYIWGDFLPPTLNAIPRASDAEPPPVWTLPFSFSSNISGPLHLLERMDVDIFTTLASHDLWIFNTLYAKFRGTASARLSTRDGRPEVAAVHPLWCLANHDCDPNVQWEWGGHMRLWARETRVDPQHGRGGIRAGDEILNHYCDIALSVGQRREWAQGSLGGWCMCLRCRREEAELRIGSMKLGDGDGEEEEAAWKGRVEQPEGP
ncbi:MAG: hypothetical protein M1818_004596 [Claussenomyces sp. TS43310]|nr:MAG: hypothetical protein M1818_004596 [Claussenomyces sp. TS43310]